MSDNLVFFGSVVVVLLGIMGYSVIVDLKKLEAVKSAVEQATAKGIDPIAIRCAYATERDQICLVYAANLKK